MNFSWSDVASLEANEREAALCAIQDMIKADANPCIERDPCWLEAQADSERNFQIWLCMDPARAIVGWVPVFVHPSALTFQTFGVALFEFRVWRHCITGEPTLLIEPSSRAGALRALMEKLGERFDRRGVAFGLGVPFDSDFCRFLSQDKVFRRRFRVLPFGPPYMRRLVELPDTFESYLNQLGKSTRKDLRRQERRLAEEVGELCSCRVYIKESEVEEFLAAAETVSRKTYQWRLLDLTVKRDPVSMRRLTRVARQGWFRGYVLFCRGEPVSFQLGYLYRNTYHAYSIGYDPTWAEWSVGNVLYQYMVRDLITLAVRRVDFMYGDSESKERLSNASRAERNYFVIPRRLPLTLVACALEGFNSVAEKIGRGLEQFGLKTKIRRTLRRWSTRREGGA